MDPAWQRRGMGKRLMRRAEVKIARRGGRLMVLETSSQEFYAPTDIPDQRSTRGTLKERIWEALQPTPQQWDDWKWHFRNQFNAPAKLARIFPLSETHWK